MGGIRLYVLLILAMIGSGLAAILPFAWTGSSVLESSYQEYALRNTRDNANFLALALSRDVDAQSSEGWHALVGAARGKTGIRYTLIAHDGTVLADSDEDAQRMENHASRPEIQKALVGQTGVDIRQSPTLGTDWLYTAVPQGNGVIVRAATSLAEIDHRLWHWWQKAFLSFCISLVILLALALLIARTLSRPLELAAVGAEKYAKGEFNHRLPISGSTEMRRLSTSLGDMATELDTRFRLIRQQREEMRIVFENMSEGILAVDMDARILLINQAAERLLHLAGTCYGCALESSIRNAELIDIIKNILQSDEPQEKEISVPGNGNGEVLLQVYGLRIYTQENNKAAGGLIVLRDITRLRQLERIRRDFVANVSHELRTPITAIQGCLETLLDDREGSDETSEFLKMALRNSRRMSTIIENLLFLAGMEAGNNQGTGKIALSPVCPVLDEVFALCKERAQSRGMRIDIHCEAEVMARMDSRLLIHALVNLVDNSIKYGQENTAIMVSARQEGNNTHIAVTDYGPGIAPRHQSRIFERFYRVSDGRQKTEGAGLGLAIARHIALSLGGDIKLASEIGKGSTFTLVLPC